MLAQGVRPCRPDHKGCAAQTSASVLHGRHRVNCGMLYAPSKLPEYLITAECIHPTDRRPPSPLYGYISNNLWKITFMQFPIVIIFKF